MAEENLHRKNAAEWVMWAFWIPTIYVRRWFARLSDARRLLLAVGLGCVVGGIWQGGSVGRIFTAFGVLAVLGAVRSVSSPGE